MDHSIAMTPAEQVRAIDGAREVATEFNKVGARHDCDNTFPCELASIFRESGLVA